MTTNTRHDGLSIDRGLGSATGTCALTLQSLDAAWRPEVLDPVAIWSPVHQITDAAITADDTTLTTSQMTFTSDDVGLHVRVTGAGESGRDLFATILSVTDILTVELDVAAGTTVTAAAALIGVCRFTGVLSNLGEQRCGDATNTREFPADAEDLTGALRVLFPRGTYAEQRLRVRLAALLTDTGADVHGVTLGWLGTISAFDFVDGNNFLFIDGNRLISVAPSDQGEFVAAVTYDGRTSLADVIDDLITEENQDRAWRLDAMGRLHADLPLSQSLPQTLTTSDVRWTASTQRTKGDYYNRVVYTYGADLDARVIVEDPAEIADLDNRVFEKAVDDSTATTLATATARATTLLAAGANRGLYIIEQLRTSVDRIEPGQFGTITLAERAVSGTHLIQRVRATYFGLNGLSWEFELVATNGTVRVADFTDYWLQVQ